MFKSPATMLAIPKMVVLASLLTIASENSARAADITFLCGAALQPALKELIPEFQAASGHNVKISYTNIGTITDRVRKGDAADLVVVSPQQWDDLQKEGKLSPTTRVVIAKVGVGILVKKGAAKPDVSSSEGVKRALLSARSIVTPNPSTGNPAALYAVRLFDRLGISSEVKPKTLHGSPRQLVGSGDAEIGLWQISEILEFPEIELVAPLPADIQNYTIFNAAIPVNAREPAAAKSLVEFLMSPRAATVLKSKGLELS